MAAEVYGRGMTRTRKLIAALSVIIGLFAPAAVLTVAGPARPAAAATVHVTCLSGFKRADAWASTPRSAHIACAVTIGKSLWGGSPVVTWYSSPNYWDAEMTVRPYWGSATSRYVAAWTIPL